MKSTLFTLLVLLSAAVYAGDKQYQQAMGSGIPAMFEADDPEELQEAINKLARIGDAEKDKWEPYYYTAFGYLRLSGMMEAPTDKDKYLNLAIEEVEKAIAIKPSESELEAMRGYVYMMQLAVDPATRGMKYSGLAYTAFEKALAMNPENPRAHFLMGRMQYGAAKFMGGDTSEACNSLGTARKIFEQDKSNDNPFAPAWGKEATEQALESLCL